MKKFKYFFAIAAIIFLSCTKEDSLTWNEKLNGVWNLENIIQNKDSQYTVLQIGNSKFEFKSNAITIIGDTYLHKTGTYSYIVSSENYFEPAAAEPRTNILKIDNIKYIVEIDYEGKYLTLTNYSDGRIKYLLSK